jgi:hypothetical protein
LIEDRTARADAAMARVGLAIGVHAEHLARAIDPRVSPHDAITALGGVLLLAFLRGLARAAHGEDAAGPPDGRAWLERRLTEVVEGSGPDAGDVAAAVDEVVAATRSVDAAGRARLAAERRAAASRDLDALELPPVRVRRILDAVADNAVGLVDARCAEIAHRQGA